MSENAPLVNLALLEALKGQSITDEIDIFVPYLALSICKIDKESFDIQDIKTQFTKEFSVAPPESALQVILTRAKKQGYLKLSNHQYFKVPDKLQEIESNSRIKRKELDASLNALIVEFKSYSTQRYSKLINDDEAQSFLYDYIANNISAFVETLVSSTFNKLTTQIKNKDYLAASFIAYLHKEKPEKHVYLENIVKGILLANYVTLADKISPKSSFNNITIYLDTPIILGLLGYSGQISSRTLSEFIELLTSLNINICVFEITIDEIEKIFGAWIDSFKNKDYTKFNPKTLELLRARNFDVSALESEKILIEKRVENLKITIKSNFILNKDFQCDETALEETLKKSGLRNDLRHDLKCISRIHNSRENKKIKNFSDKFSIFATLNPVLERSVNDFFKNEEAYTKSIPIVASEKWLATVLWLKKPNLFLNLPKNILLTHAYGTIYSDDKFWSKFITKLNDLEKRGDITEKDFVLVRWDKNLIEKIHDISIETGIDFKDQDIFDVVESIKKEYEEAHAKELRELTFAKDEEISKEIRKSELSEIKNTKLNLKIDNLAKIISHAISSLIIILLLCVFIVPALYLSTPNARFLEKDTINYDQPIIGIIIIVFLVFSLFSYIYGLPIKQIYSVIQTTIKAKIINYFD